MFVSHRCERFKSALNNSLCADVDPTPSRHLTVHHQTSTFELMKVFPVGPGSNQVGIGDQHSRSVFMCSKHTDRFTGLDQQRLVVFKLLQLANNCVERLPVACSFT